MEGRQPERRRAPSGLGIAGVRESDLAPYTGLSYVAKLFKILSAALVIMVLGETVVGLIQEGVMAIPELLGEIARLAALAGIMWGVGDLVLLAIDVGHDVRALRILETRQKGAFKGSAGPSSSIIEEGAPPTS